MGVDGSFLLLLVIVAVLSWSTRTNPKLSNYLYLVVYNRLPLVDVVLTLTHGYNAVRGHRTGSYKSQVENTTSGGKQIKTEDNTHNN